MNIISSESMVIFTSSDWYSSNPMSVKKYAMDRFPLQRYLPTGKKIARKVLADSLIYLSPKNNKPGPQGYNASKST